MSALWENSGKRAALHIWARLRALLVAGVTPRKLALSVAIGAALGVFPVLGSTMLLCAIAAWILRLNLAAIQAVNYIVYPLQFLLLIPFMRIGESIFRAPHLPLTASQIAAMIHAGVWTAIQALWQSTLYGIVAWTILAPPAAVLLYFTLLPIFKRIEPI